MREFNLKSYAHLTNEALELHMPSAKDHPGIIHEAMRYSVFAGGKRLRPAIGFIAHEMFGGNVRDFQPAAAAIECLHTYSLIHDDLPSMDNDDLRRGKPTCHRMYGEAVAILAGDALLTLAFELMTLRLRENFSATQVLQATGELAVACGTYGLIGGQTVDVLAEGQEVPNPEQTVEYIHTHKTGALITASLRTGAILAGATKDELAALSRYGHYLGLCFQIRDDILDHAGEESRLGKTLGKDKKSGKLTYVSVYGPEKAEEHLHRCHAACVGALKPLRETDSLLAVAALAVERDS